VLRSTSLLASSSSPSSASSEESSRRRFAGRRRGLVCGGGLSSSGSVAPDMCRFCDVMYASDARRTCGDRERERVVEIVETEEDE
jgi:hypothetical protein